MQQETHVPDSGGHKAERCILHVGPPKTGTTSIQRSLHAAAENLAKEGYHYPTFSINHQFFASCFGPRPEELGFHRKSRRSPEQIQKYNYKSLVHFEAEFRAIKPHTLVLSSEFLAHRLKENPAPFVDYIKNFAQSFDVYYYVRSPFTAAQSQLFYRIKRGDGSLDDIQMGNHAGGDRVGIETWKNQFGRDAIHVRPFPGDLEPKRDVVEDFLGATGMAGLSLEITPVHVNSATSGAAVMLAGAINKSIPRFSTDRMEFQVLEAITGPKMRLEHEFFEKVLKSNRAMLEYLRDEWGITFEEPGSSGNRSSVEELFTQETIESIALLINDLAVQLRRANKALRKLGEKTYPRSKL